LDEVSLEAWIDAWREALGRLPGPHYLIAESLGAMVAMCLPARAVVAVDPLLSVDQIWPQRRALVEMGDSNPPAYRALFDHPFDWVLERISAPTLVIAGDEPLLPERATARPPSLLTDADLERYAAHPQVEALRIPGGHALLDENPGEVLALATAFFRQHGWSPDAQSE
jgi:pimeloyl-ACP methyl ester carboxylesterase